MTFRITINQELEVAVKEKAYETLADTGNDRDGGPVYGYVWSDGVEKKVFNVLDLRVEEIDLQLILDAVMRRAT